MTVIIYVLDDPKIKHNWAKHIVTIDTLDDIEKIIGHCHRRMFAYISNLSGNESKELHEVVIDILAQYNVNLPELVECVYLIGKLHNTIERMKEV